jgi:hypothetical protein
MSIKLSGYIFLRCYDVQITALSPNVVFHNLMCSKVADLVNLQGVSKGRSDRCMRSAREFVKLWWVVCFMKWPLYPRASPSR